MNCYNFLLIGKIPSNSKMRNKTSLICLKT